MADVVVPQVIVTVDGVETPVKSVSVTREIATDLPARVTGGGGMMAATGTIEWAPHRRGISDPAYKHPLPGSRVKARVGVDGANGATHQIFTGTVDESSGSIAEGTVSSSVVDDTVDLDRVISLPTRFAKAVGTNGVVDVELSSAWLALEVGRLCGLSTYHFNPGTAVLWASLAGSILPSFSATPNYLNNDNWQAVQTPSGVGMALATGALVEYPIPALANSGGESSEWSIWCDPGEDAVAYLRVSGYNPVGNETGWVLEWGGGNVILSRFHHDPSGPANYKVALLSAPASGWQPIAAHVRWTASGWVASLRVGANSQTAAPHTDALGNPPAHAANDTWRAILGCVATSGTPATVAGLVVDRHRSPDAQWAALDHVSRLLYTFDNLAPSLLRFRVQPPQNARVGLEILKEVASAELASLWITEEGVLRYSTRGAMRLLPATKVIRSDGALLDLEWQDSLAAVHSRVVVRWRYPVYSVRPSYTLTVWEADTDATLKQEDGVTSWIVEPGTDHDWLDPDFGFSGASKRGRVNGSWWGGTVNADADDAVVRNVLSGDVDVTVDRLANDQAVVTMAATSDVPASQYVALAGPILKARGTATWTDRTTTCVSTNGPLASAPELVHDGGWVLQTPNIAAAVGNYLANLTAKPLLQLERVSIKPDPSIHLGDRVIVEDEAISGLTLNGIVTRISQTWSETGVSMDLGVRVTSVSQTFVTLAEFDARWAGANLGALDAAWAGETLAALDAAPLL